MGIQKQPSRDDSERPCGRDLAAPPRYQQMKQMAFYAGFKGFGGFKGKADAFGETNVIDM